MATRTLFLSDEAATLQWGSRIADLLESGLVIYLRGELGAGKTTLARGILRGLGHAGPVKSPTYTLVEVYELSRLNLHHFDFYRFQDPREWIDAGFRESFNPHTVGLIEWPEKAAGTLPPADLEITLIPSGTGRNASFIAASPEGERIVESLMRRGDLTSAAS